MRMLSTIAAEIRKDWRNVYFGAVPYVDAMRELSTIDDKYFADEARSIVAYFLANASSWRGETAKRIKAELKGQLATQRGAARQAIEDAAKRLDKVLMRD